LSDADRWDFAFKDLARRKFQTVLTILSLAICVSVTVFLALFGDNLGVEVTSFAGGGLTVGFSEVFSRFILVVIVLNSAAGILVAYFLITVTISERVRDVGIMKAVGCLTEVVFNYFATELSVIVFLSCGFGTVGGILLNFASMGLMNLLGFRISAKPLNPWSIILIFFSFAFTSYILGMRRIAKAAEMEPTKALSPIFIWKTVQRPTLRLPVPFRGGFTAKMALRDLDRRRPTTLQSVACLSAIMTLITLALVGGIVANETTQIYVERAIGRDVVLVAEARMAEHYGNLLEKFYSFGQKGQMEQIDYLDEKYVIPSSVISDLGEIDGVVNVDSRLVLEATIYEYPAVLPDPDNPDQYVMIGDHRSGRALILGVHPEKLANDWLILGKNLGEAEINSALIGDSLALNLFENPWKQSFKMLNAEFKVAGVCLDPLNNGMVVYVSFDRLSSVVKHAGYNVLLLQIDPTSRSRVIGEIEARISRTGLTMFDLNRVLERHRAFLSYIWSLMLSLSLFSFVNAILSLIGYLMLSISSQQKDLGIMRALGAKPKTVIKVILLETFLLVLVSGIIGVPIGAIIAFWFFIPEAIVSQAATVSIIGLLSILIGALCLSSLYPARKIAKTPITRAIN